MRIPRRLVLSATFVVAMIASGAALAVGPWPGLARTVQAPTGGVRYGASVAGRVTTLKALRAASLTASATFPGSWGIPAITSTGVAGGLSPDGRLLVLAEPPVYEGLRDRSRFLVVSTRDLLVVDTIVLRGEFGFDAVSPNRRTLYVIQHTSSNDLVRYVVRAYDLRAGRLLPGAIVDKRAPDETMRGYPVARATSARGAWVYTLYNRNNAEGPFVHALNTAARTAFCIDLPRWPAKEDIWSARLELVKGRAQLVVRAPGGAAVARIDTTTLTVR